ARDISVGDTVRLLYAGADIDVTVTEVRTEAGAKTLHWADGLGRKTMFANTTVRRVKAAQADRDPAAVAATLEWATEDSTEELAASEARELRSVRVGEYRAKVVEFTWDTGARLLIWREDHGRVPLADDDGDGFGVRFDSLDEAQDAAEATLYDLVPM
ncbi:hypothetical protein GS502_10750, partial [Rhodococcus hoagii]|nr:hypothetical protein [Prescottella equi]